MTKATFTRPFESLRDQACLFCGGIFSSFLQTSTEPWRDFFLFLANQYRAMEGDLATRRFPKGIYDPLKNPWRDFSRARQLQMQVPQKKILTLLQNHFVAGDGSFSDCLKAVVQVFHGKAFLHRLLRCLF